MVRLEVEEPLPQLSRGTADEDQVVAEFDMREEQPMMETTLLRSGLVKNGGGGPSHLRRNLARSSALGVGEL